MNNKKKISEGNIRIYEYNKKILNLLRTIENRIEELRLENNMSVGEFSLMCSVDRKTIYKMENMSGISGIDKMQNFMLITLLKIAIASNTGIETFFSSDFLSPEVVEITNILKPLTAAEKRACIEQLKEELENITTKIYITPYQNMYIFGYGNEAVKNKLKADAIKITDEARENQNIEICYTYHKKQNPKWKYGQIQKHYEDIIGQMHIIYENGAEWVYYPIADNKINIYKA